MPKNIQVVVDWVLIVPAATIIIYMVRCYISALKGRPNCLSTDLVFQEWFASGCSHLNFITNIGGGRNCVRLVVTKDFLWVTTWFPFSLIAPAYDMEHVIPLSAITAVNRDKFLGTQTFLLTFTLANGKARTLRLRSKRPEQFISSLLPKTTV